jgi:CYTH domain-containing protein
MAIEIERKFLVNNLVHELTRRGLVEITQGYLPTRRGATVRVRITERKEMLSATLTIKGPSKGIARPEFEYEIPVDDGLELLALCGKRVVRKFRFRVPADGDLVWEVDVFRGRHDGLVLAEIELDKPNRKVRRPKWVGAEVSGDSRYSSHSLAMHGLKFVRTRKIGA